MTTSNYGLDSTAKLNVENSPFTSHPSTPIVPSSRTDFPTANPWNDVASASINDTASEKVPVKPLGTLDPSLYDQPIFAGLKEDRTVNLPTTPIPNNEGSREVLSEFDPLCSEEEKAAREAWETSEGHPPPPRTPSPPPPSKSPYTSPGASPPDTTASASSATAITSSSSFPTFATLAKTFSIPLVGRSRPVSLDATAQAVPTPTSSSSFAAQQGNPPTERLDAGKSSASESSPNPSGSGSDGVSPAPKPADSAFDFQRFLDQMKSKSADPVSKYLKSYVWFFQKFPSSNNNNYFRFLSNFAKRTFTVNDQVKIINDFLNVSILFIGQASFSNTFSSSQPKCENAMCGNTFQMLILKTPWKAWRNL